MSFSSSSSLKPAKPVAQYPGREPWGEVACALLALDGAGDRLLPLVHGRDSESAAAGQVRAALRGKQAGEVFPEARVPDAALAGLWLYFSCWEEAHTLSDACHKPEGHWFHAIVHRQEPDYWNSGYWYRRVPQSHPVMDQLAGRAATADLRTLKLPIGEWDPSALNAAVERAIGEGNQEMQEAARRLQRTEWQLLFSYCAAAPANVAESRNLQQRTEH